MIELKIGEQSGGMDWLEWSTHIVASLAWPVAVVIILCVLRPAIVRLLRQISKLTWGDKAVDFSNGLDRLETTNTAAIEAAATAAGLEIDKADIDVESAATKNESEQRKSGDSRAGRDIKMRRKVHKKISDDSEFGTLLSISPASAVIDAWRPVEAAIMEVYDATGIAGQGQSFVSPHMMVKRLADEGLVSPVFQASVMELKRLRNLAVHAGRGISTDDALRFKRNADILVSELQSVLKK
ncbi:hypothetical protein [Brucella intermedia]|uniref:hypothetical protein n=1 Tax=Brucella intermedia TaxID=94625 RepID=UPI001115854D|nr:hypothetical protein [Brucella intermedia]